MIDVVVIVLVVMVGVDVDLLLFHLLVVVQRLTYRERTEPYCNVIDAISMQPLPIHIMFLLIFLKFASTSDNDLNRTNVKNLREK